jgi:Ala-tRNA(Pro) deacylase
MTDEKKKQLVLNFFNSHGLAYRLYEHPAFFTVADVHAYTEAHGQSLHAAGVTGCKNLFLKNYVEKPVEGEAYRYYLYVLPDIERADLKAFASFVGEKKVTFGSPEELLHYLGVTPGSVSLCGLLHDVEKKVQVVVDSRVMDAPLVHLHPNINTASLEMTHEVLCQYLIALERKTRIYRVGEESK